MSVIDKGGWGKDKSIPTTITPEQAVSNWLKDHNWETKGFAVFEPGGGGNHGGRVDDGSADDIIIPGSEAQGGDGGEHDDWEDKARDYYEKNKNTGINSENGKWMLYAAIAIGIISIIKK